MAIAIENVRNYFWPSKQTIKITQGTPMQVVPVAKRGKTCNRRCQARENTQPVPGACKRATGAKRGKTSNQCKHNDLRFTIFFPSLSVEELVCFYLTQW